MFTVKECSRKTFMSRILHRYSMPCISITELTLTGLSMGALCLSVAQDGPYFLSLRV